MQYLKKSGYNFYSLCRSCGKKLSKPVIDLGEVPLAGGFLTSKKQFTKEKLYPLTLSFCSNCYLLQTNQVINSSTLFKNYFYFSSKIKTLVEHFKSLANDLSKQYYNPNNKLIVEIGCNDGSFLNACLNRGFKVFGIDPATNIVSPLIKKGMPIINGYFSQRLAKKIIKKYGKADVIFSSNTLAHIEDMHDVFTGIKNLLKDDGQFIFEVHYLGKLIKEMQYDMIYHEHQYYYSLHAVQNYLKKHNLEVFDIKLIPTHAGSIRFYVKHSAYKKEIKVSVSNLLKQEQKLGLLDKNTFKQFNSKIKATKKDLLSVLSELKKQNKTLAGYGASGRGTIIMNYCGLNRSFLDNVIDDAPAKQGAFTPGTHLEIVSSESLHKSDRPDYVLLFAWSFWEEIKKRNKNYIKNGGKFIIPLPKVKVI
ncbi:class I SAM-dependent methyltransferase [Candidatus Roizmanbacteria bacterium]|nr:class I SAM-dependent methyltransferase [Candidatus Roizmanbacteria bacterium]